MKKIAISIVLRDFDRNGTIRWGIPSAVISGIKLLTSQLFVLCMSEESNLQEH
jgi:hypothetical protein